jgi:hypothetical protein
VPPCAPHSGSPPLAPSPYRPVTTARHRRLQFSTAMEIRAWVRFYCEAERKYLQVRPPTHTPAAAEPPRCPDSVASSRRTRVVLKATREVRRAPRTVRRDKGCPQEAQAERSVSTGRPTHAGRSERGVCGLSRPVP